MARAKIMFLAQDIQVSANTVPVHRRHIHPLEGSNCIMMGRRALVRTLSSMRSSNRFTVDACSIMAWGVVNTMCSAVGDATDDSDEEDLNECNDLGLLTCRARIFRCDGR